MDFQKAFRTGLAGIFVAAPLIANAQTTNLVYQGDVIEGTLDYLPDGYSSSSFSLPSATFIGTYTASLKFTGSVKQNTLKLLNYKFQFSGISYVKTTLNHFSLDLSLAELASVQKTAPNKFCGDLGCVTVKTAANGEISAAVVVVDNAPNLGVSVPVTLGQIESTGDSISYAYADPTQGSCQNFLFEGPYEGATIYPCDVTGDTHSAGKWLASYSN